jgi:hypothetical protein
MSLLGNQFLVQRTLRNQTSSGTDIQTETILNNLLLRMGNVESTAVTRSVDTFFTGVTSFNIPLDFSGNDSITVNLTLKTYGNYNGHIFMFYGRAGTQYNFDKGSSEFTVQSNSGGVPTMVNVGIGSTPSSLMIAAHINTGTVTSNFTIKVNNSYDANTLSQRYYFKVDGVYEYNNSNNLIGITKSDCWAYVSSQNPDQLRFTMESATADVFYSIVNDKRVTSNNIATITNIVSSTAETNTILNSLLTRTTQLEVNTNILVFWSDQTQAAAHNTLSLIINYTYIWVNRLTLVNNNTNIFCATIEHKKFKFPVKYAASIKENV